MVVDPGSQAAIVFDADRDEVLAVVPYAGTASMGDCAITSDQRLGFVTNFASQIHVIDLEELELAAGPNPVPVTSRGLDVALTPDDRFLAICGGSAPGALSILDVDARVVTDSFRLGSSCGAVDACDDGASLLMIPSVPNVARVLLDDAGRVHDPAEFLSVTGPRNVACVPGSWAGVAVGNRPPVVTSLAVEGPLQLDRLRLSEDPFEDLVFAVATHPNGTAIYPMSQLWVRGFGFDPETGAIDAEPLFEIPVAPQTTLGGTDQIAVHPRGDKLYFSQPGRVEIRDAGTGAVLRSLTDPSIQSPTGICFPRLRNLEVEIDVRPHDPHNILPLGSLAVVPIAILGAPGFDIAQLDETTLAFGPAGASLVHEHAPRRLDVDGDSDLDLIAFFRVREAGIPPGTSDACVSAQLFDGTLVRGCDEVSAHAACGGGFQAAFALPLAILLRGPLHGRTRTRRGAWQLRRAA